MTRKFLVYDMEQDGFVVSKDTRSDGADIQGAVIQTAESMGRHGLDATDESKYIRIPLTREFVENLPFDLADADPDVPHSEAMDRNAAVEGPFVVLTEYGFYDERYNEMENTSRPKVRSFELDYANLYTFGKLQEMGNEFILDPSGNVEPILVPLSDVQLEVLKEQPKFSPEKEPHGFFMEPLGETQKKENTELLGLGEALDDLESNTASQELPWEM